MSNLVNLIQVTDHVYCVQRRAYLSCSYFVRREKDVIFVDSGMDPTGNDMLSALKQTEAKVSDISALLLTHWHNDHSAGAGHIQQQTGAPAFYHRYDEEKFTRLVTSSGFVQCLATALPSTGILAPMKGLLDAAPPTAIHAQSFIEDGDRIAEDFLVIHTPGHEKGHVSFFYEPERVLFAGDALAVCGGKVSFMSRLLTVDVESARSSMLRCLELKPSFICPGHRSPLQITSPQVYEKAQRHLLANKAWPYFSLSLF